MIGEQDTAKGGMDARRWGIWLAFLVLSLEASIASGAAYLEQIEFNADSPERVTRPVPVPEPAAQILARDDVVAACLKDNPISHGRSLASWFVASEIHLNGPEEADIVVLPVAQGEPFLCFHSAEGIGWFWIFRRTGGRYELVLKTPGLSLSILDTRHNGYRDIRSGGQVGTFGTATIFRFEDGRYREYRKKTTEVR